MSGCFCALFQAATNSSKGSACLITPSCASHVGDGDKASLTPRGAHNDFFLPSAPQCQVNCSPIAILRIFKCHILPECHLELASIWTTTAIRTVVPVNVYENHAGDTLLRGGSVTCCESLKPKVWSQEPTPATRPASSPFCVQRQHRQAMSVHVAVLWTISCWLTLLESEIGRGNSISGLKKPEVNQNLHDFKSFLGQKSQNKWRPTVWFQVHKSLDLQTLQTN